MSQAIPEGAPERDTFAFVLVRTDWEPVLSFWFHTYNEVANSRKVRMHGRDVHALFVLKDTTRDRALWKGWKDVTEEYLRDPAMFEIAPDEPVPRDVAEQPDRSPDAWKDRILNALAIKGKLQRVGIMDATGIPDVTYRAVMPELVRDGAVKQSGSGNQTFYEVVV